MIKWKEAELGEYCDFQEGYVNPSKEHPEYFGGSVKWCRAVDINDGYIYHTSQTLTEEGFKSAKKSALLFEPNTIVISKSGTIGRVGIIKDYMCGNRATINIKPKNNADVEFIFYMLKSKQREFADLAVGSVQKNLYVSILEKIKFKFPSLDNQKKISSYISTIDKKIEINNQINRNLSEKVA
jgi:type I restriction enzyme S subunit